MTRHFYRCIGCNKAGLKNRTTCPRCGSATDVTAYEGFR